MPDDDQKAVAIYHQMKAGDTFEDTAQRLHRLVRDAERKWPGQPRHLYFDIEGHRNAAGGFDRDALEIQQNFIVGFLGPWLTEFGLPLLHGTTKNPNPQRNDVLEEVVIAKGGKSADRERDLHALAEATGQAGIFDADNNEFWKKEN